jgi:hypothetical protein
MIFTNIVNLIGFLIVFRLLVPLQQKTDKKLGLCQGMEYFAGTKFGGTARTSPQAEQGLLDPNRPQPRIGETRSSHEAASRELSSPLTYFFLVIVCVFSLCDCLNSTPTPDPTDGKVPSTSQIMIPGPLHSFLRIAASAGKSHPSSGCWQSQRVQLGYVANSQPTEFLVLLAGYVRQARIDRARRADGAIHVSKCDDAKNLLLVLGYRVEGTVVETCISGNGRSQKRT